MSENTKTWGFDYRTVNAMREANTGYDPESGEDYEVCEFETFHSKSPDFDEACKEFDEFELCVELWDVDPEASFNNGEEYRNIVGRVNYNGF